MEVWKPGKASSMVTARDDGVEDPNAVQTLELENPGVSTRLRFVRLASVAVSCVAIIMFVSLIAIQIAIVCYQVQDNHIDPNYSFMLFVAMILACDTKANLRKDELDTTTQSLRMGTVVDVALVCIDILTLAAPSLNGETISRAPFLILGFVNVLLRIIIISRLHVWREVIGIAQCFAR